MTVLDKIVSSRRADVATLDAGALRQAADRFRERRAPGRLRQALQAAGRMKVIAEFKRASPSLGAIRSDAQVADFVPVYERASACAISIVTEPAFFCGSLNDLSKARVLTQLPILRKDFLIAESQVDEAAAAGADAVLLIAAVLSDSELQRLRIRAEDELGLDALVEVHSREEMDRATRCGARLIGVNNRNLHTFTISLRTSEDLAPFAPADAILVSESGVSSAQDAARLAACGYHAVLVGESLMRTADRASFIASLRGTTQVKVCGVTSLNDALLCADAGVEMVGLNFWPGSIRCVSPHLAREIIAAIRPRFPATKFVGVFVNQDRKFVQNVVDTLALDALQLHGDEPPEYVDAIRAPFIIKALRVEPEFSRGMAERYNCDAILLDAYTPNARGGTGETFPWSIAFAVKPYVKRLILAGGLNVENVREAITVVGPFAIDVCSGVEDAAGQKNSERLRRFVAAVTE